MRDEHPRILIVDDDEAHADIVAEVLDRSSRDYECVTVHDGEAAQRVLALHHFDVALLDLKLPDIDGMKLLEVIRERSPETEVLIMTGYGSVTNAVEALQKGAFSFLEKPLQKDHLRNQVAKALERKQLASDNRELRQMIQERFGFEGIIGNSPAMRAVFERIRQVAPTDARVLVTGPNGSGKELVARAIHVNSKRHAARMVAFNCGAISGDLLQSELFGHVKGAFTGADRERDGKFEYANGGTLFLDEIGEMPLEAQVKLLRVLETNEVARIGANESSKIDVRLISATNKHLQEEVARGRFREDLYFRLKVIEIELPSLKERGNDVILLAEHYMREYAEKYEKPLTSIRPDVASALLAHDWPGNVRELRNTIEEMAILSSGSELLPDALPFHLRDKIGQAPLIADAGTPVRKPQTAEGMSKEQLFQALVGCTMEDIERGMITSTLAALEGNRERTARALGIGERTLYRKIKTWNL